MSETIPGMRISERELLRRVAIGRKPTSRRQKSVPRWSYVMDQFLLGSSYAHLLCNHLKLDPDEKVSP